MYINVVLKHLACGGALVSAASFLTDVGMVSALTQSNATNAGSRRPDFDPTLAVQRVKTATADGDDDGDEYRSNSFSEKLSQAMKSLVQGELNSRGFKYKRLEAENEVVTNSLTSKVPLYPENLVDNLYRDYVSKIEPERLFDDPRFKEWIDMTIQFLTVKYGKDNVLWIEFETYDVIYQTLCEHLGADMLTRLLKDSTSPPIKLVEAQLRANESWELLIKSYGYNDVKLVDMLRVPSARYHKSKIMDILLSKWKTNYYHLVIVLRHLRLSEPEIDVWLDVMHALNQFPSEIFDSSVALDDKIIAKMIGAALLSESSEKVSSGKIASRKLMRKWLQDGLTVWGLFDKLNLTFEEIWLNSSPLVTIWKIYKDLPDVGFVRTRRRTYRYE